MTEHTRPIEPNVIAAVASVLNQRREDVRLDDDLRRDLGADDLDVTEIVSAIEGRLGVSLPDTACDAALVGDLLAAVRAAAGLPEDAH